MSHSADATIAALNCGRIIADACSKGDAPTPAARHHSPSNEVPRKILRKADLAGIPRIDISPRVMTTLTERALSPIGRAVPASARSTDWLNAGGDAAKLTLFQKSRTSARSLFSRLPDMEVAAP